MTWTSKSYMTRSTRHDEHDWTSPSRPLTGLAVWADAEWLRGGSGNAARGSCTASNILRPIGDGTTSDFIWLLLSGSRSLLLETSSSPLPPRPRHPGARDDPAPSQNGPLTSTTRLCLPQMWTLSAKDSRRGAGQ
jgi:hypothetical protein